MGKQPPGRRGEPLHRPRHCDARSGLKTAALYLALAGSGLASKVMRGENGGATLAHDLEL